MQQRNPDLPKAELSPRNLIALALGTIEARLGQVIIWRILDCL
jgi:hypothetical protein